MKKDHYFVFGCKPWSKQIFDSEIKNYPGQWHYVASLEELELSELEKHNPRYLFFLHWSYLVPKEIVERYECVCFHMTDLPYGRGGSPLQNLIAQGHKSTTLTAFRMTQELDAGPVYFKEPLSLSGSAQEIYQRASELSSKLIKTLITKEIQPKAQSGNVVLFKRRNPKESELNSNLSIEQVYDFIRMLDAETYPKAFINYGNLHIEFEEATVTPGKVKATVTISERGNENENTSDRVSSRR